MGGGAGSGRFCPPLTPRSRSFDSDVTNTSSTETDSSSASKSCPTPSSQSTEVSSQVAAGVPLRHRAHLVSLAPPRDAGHEGLDPQLSGEEGGGLRAGEERPAQRPPQPRLYPWCPHGEQRLYGAANQNRVGSGPRGEPADSDMYVMGLYV